MTNQKEPFGAQSKIDFGQPKEKCESPNKASRPPMGKSKIAANLRAISLVSLVLSFVLAIVFFTEGPVFICTLIGCAIIECLLFFALAEMLDNLTEQTAIMREYFVHKENKE